MSTVKRSGIKAPVGTDGVTRANYNENLDIIDSRIRYDYREKVDTTTWDAALKIYTKVEYYRPEDNTLHLRCVLSTLVGGYYTKDTWTFYDAAGTTVVQTVTWTLSYDASGNLVDKVPVFS